MKNGDISNRTIGTVYIDLADLLVKANTKHTLIERVKNIFTPYKLDEFILKSDIKRNKFLGHVIEDTDFNLKFVVIEPDITGVYLHFKNNPNELRKVLGVYGIYNANLILLGVEGMTDILEYTSSYLVTNGTNSSAVAINHKYCYSYEEALKYL